MNQAQHAETSADRPFSDRGPDDETPSLHDRAVIDVLEAEVADDDAYRPIVGIRNGLLIGVGFWAIVLAVLGVISGLGYL